MRRNMSALRKSSSRASTKRSAGFSNTCGKIYPVALQTSIATSPTWWMDFSAHAGSTTGVSDEPGRVIFDIAEDVALPAELGQARRFRDRRRAGLKDTEALNLLHPLVQAAIADARACVAAGSHQAASAAHRFRGACRTGRKEGLLCVLLVDYAGFEPVQSLVAAAVVAGTPIDPSLAAEILRLPATKGPAFESAVDAQSLDDAVDEAVFVDQRRIEEREHQHFEQAIGQLERYVEDKILVCRRERASITGKTTLRAGPA